MQELQGLGEELELTDAAAAELHVEAGRAFELEGLDELLLDLAQRADELRGFDVAEDERLQALHQVGEHSHVTGRVSCAQQGHPLPGLASLTVGRSRPLGGTGHWALPLPPEVSPSWA